MTIVQKKQEELIAAQKAVASLLDTPKADRTADYAAKREKALAELEEAKIELKAAMLSDLPDDENGSKAKAQAEAEAQARAKAQAPVTPVIGAGGKSKGFGIDLADLKAAINARQRYHAEDIDFARGVKAAQNRRYKAIGRADMDLGNGYEDLVLQNLREPQLIDFLPMVPTLKDSVTFRRQTVTLDAAAPRAEKASLPNATTGAAKVTIPIEAVGHLFDVSIEEMEDDPSFQSLLVQAGQGVMAELESQVISGSGTAPALQGIVNSEGIRTHTYATNRTITIKKGLTSLEETERERADVLLMNPADWDNILGDWITNPSFVISPIQEGIGFRMWSRPVIASFDVTAGHVYGINSQQYPLYMRKGLTLDSSNSDGSKFGQMLETYRAYVRAALVMRKLGAIKIALS